MRVETPAYTDAWMRGDRFGEVIGAFVLAEGEHEGSEVFRVKLDISGRVGQFLADDCRVV